MGTTVAEHIVETLVREGVERVYGLTGDSLNAITDEIHSDGRLRFVHVRHEEAAALMASAEAQATGRLAVCAGSCGPGNLHLVNGLFDAHRAGAPVLALASHIPSGQIGTGYFQETHPERLFAECSHYCEMANGPGHAARVLRGAIQHAVGRRGVGVMVLSGDLSGEDLPAHVLDAPIARPRPLVRPNDAELAELAGLVNGAKRVCVFGGYGCREAHDEVVALAAKLNAPVGHTSRGKAYLEWENPYDVGMNGLIGFGGFPAALEGCDLLLLLGCDFPYTDFYPKDARIVQIDARAEVLGRRTHVDLGLVGDVRETLRALLPLLDERTDDRFLRHAKLIDARSRRHVGQYVEHVDPQRPIHPELVAATLSELMADDAVVTADTGLCNVWLARHVEAKPGRELLASWVHGTMANALPYAAGAQAAFPGRQVVAMAGDGGLAMLMGELLTLVQEGLPVKVVVFNNASLGFVALEMQAGGMREFATDLKNPDFGAVARACGMAGERVERPADLRAAIERLLAEPGPALLDVVTDPHALSMPPRISLAQAKGFAITELKTILAGDLDEVLETAKSNLRFAIP